MSRPRLLDLFCKQGGAGKGYHDAGFEVVGVDIEPQPRYPFEFHQGDALEYLAEHWREFDAVHGSPVCKRYSSATPVHRRDGHPDQIGPLRSLLEATTIPWVIENVPGAPLRPDIILCGCIAGLPELKRERWFETSWCAFQVRAACWHPITPITVAGHGEPSGPRMARGEVATKADWERAMGIDWMTRDGLAQAIPPAYTRVVGAHLLEQLAARAASAAL
jgi:DNA (cytosine-5)-methyltransferase 1